MGRLSYLSKEDLAPADQPLLERPINLFRMLAHSPGALAGLNGIGEWIRYGSGIDPRLRELAILAVGYLTASSYEFSHHVKIGQDFGVSDDDIRSLALAASGEPTGLGEVEQLVVELAREVTFELAPSAATWDALAGHFDARELVELVAVVSYYNMVVRVLASLQVDVEPDYETFLTSPVAVPWTGVTA